MRRIKITVDPVNIPDNLPYVHYATSYQFGTAIDFSIAENIIHSELESEHFLHTFTKELDIDRDAALYVRCKYHLKNSKTQELFSTNWSRILPVEYREEGYTLSDTILYTPTLTYEETNDYILATSSEAKWYSGTGTHVATTWRVVDSEQKVVYVREKDRDNKLSIRLDKSIFMPNKIYVIEAMHHCSTNAKSNWARTHHINISQFIKMFDVEVLNTMYVDAEHKYKIILYTPNVNYVELELRTPRGVTKKATGPIYGTTASMLLDTVKAFDVLELYGRLTTKEDVATEWRKLYSGIVKADTMVDVDKTIVYNKHYVPMGNTTSDRNYIMGGQNVVYAMEDRENNIFFRRNNETTLGLYKYNGQYLYKKADVLELDNREEINYIQTLPLTNGTIVINYASTTEDKFKQSKFLFAKFDTVNNQLKDVVKVDDNPANEFKELYSTAISGSMVEGWDKHIYYIPAVMQNDDGVDQPLAMFKINRDSREFTKICDIPGGLKYNVSLFTSPIGELFILGGSTYKSNIGNSTTWVRENNKIMKFNPEKNQFEDWRLLSDRWPDTIYSQHCVLRRDGKCVVFNNVHNGPSVGVHDTLVIDFDHEIVTHVDNDNDINVPFRSSINTQSGNIIRMSSIDNDPQYTMVLIAQGLLTGKLLTSAEHEKRLIVADEELVTIENPYDYEYIRVQGNGRLKVLYDNKVRWEVTSSDLLITRNTEMTEAEYEAGGWVRTFILDDVTFKIKPNDEVPEVTNVTAP